MSSLIVKLKDMHKNLPVYFQWSYIKYFLIVFFVASLIIDLNLLAEEDVEVKSGEVSSKTFIATSDFVYVNEGQVNKQLEELKKEPDNSFYKYLPEFEKAFRENMTIFYQLLSDVSDIRSETKPENLYTSLKEYADKNSIDYNLLTALNNSFDDLSYQNLSSYENKMVDIISDGDGITIQNIEDKRKEMKVYIETVFQNKIIQQHFFNIVDTNIKPTKVLDDDKTYQYLKNKEMEIKQKNTEYIQVGLKIIDKGETFTQRDVDLIDQMGLNANNQSILKYLQLNVVLLILMFGIYFACSKIIPIKEQINKVKLLAILFNIGLILITIPLLFNSIYKTNLIVVPIIIILIDIFISKRLSLFIGVVYAIMIGYITSNLTIMFVYLLISIVISLSLVKVEKTEDITKISIIVVSISLLLFFSIDQYGVFSYIDYLLLVLNIMISFFMSAQMISIIEKQFNITTHLGLMELQNHKIIDELRLKAPGTLSHSTNVANLAKNAAIKVGANYNLVYTAGLLHDIGKLYNPIMYTENHAHFQVKENPHNSLTPLDSALMIKKHIEYGVELAEKLKLPNEIKRLIRTHHGTSLIKYFYQKGCDLAKENGQNPPNKKDFSYTWGKPQTKEEGILMICDVCEAVSRSFNDSSREYLEERLPKYINSIIEEGQLDECELTFAEIKKLETTIIESLVNLNLKRTKYQNQKD